jgi:hypothetical protein
VVIGAPARSTLCESTTRIVARSACIVLFETRTPGYYGPPSKVVVVGSVVVAARLNPLSFAFRAGVHAATLPTKDGELGRLPPCGR